VGGVISSRAFFSPELIIVFTLQKQKYFSLNVTTHSEGPDYLFITSIRSIYFFLSTPSFPPKKDNGRSLPIVYALH
jgi:hypothetical protein